MPINKLKDTDVKKYYDALIILNNLMFKDGTAVKMGLNKFLRERECRYTQEVSKWLYEEGFVINNGTSRFPLISWNVKEEPTMEWVKWMLGIVTQKKNGKPTEIVEAKPKRINSKIWINEESKLPSECAILDKLKFAHRMGVEEISINKLIKYLEDENNK
jgi:hypothetical protein